MKIGMCMFLWTTTVTAEHEAILRDIRATGFDGVEIPVFEARPTTTAASATCSTRSASNAPRSRRWAIRR
jgi:sugar phosphate isomerase/epimerase